MQVVKYLKEFGINKLKDEFKIKVKNYDEEGLIVLNYDQIYSKPKDHPIIRECRGLILDSNFDIVSRSFYRFFNMGEIPQEDEQFDIRRAICFEKADGSLMKIYKHRGKWQCSTRGTAFGEAQTPTGTTFKELTFKALNVETEEQFQGLCSSHFDPKYTYNFEVTSRENRIVKVYEGHSLWFLAKINNQTGEDQTEFDTSEMPATVKELRKFTFNSEDAILTASKELKELDEGYVCLDTTSGIRLKIKSPTYLTVHSLRGEGTLTPKKIMELILMNEHEEYLCYYPEDRDYFTPYKSSLDRMEVEMGDLWKETRDIESQKDYAVQVKDKCYSAAMFEARGKGSDPWVCFNNQRDNYKVRTLEQYHNDLIEIGDTN